VKTSSQEEVQTWFKTHRNGKFLEYAQLFAKADGTDMLGLSKEDLNNNLGFPHGIALYNALHPPQKLTGIFRFSFCFFSSYSFVRYSNWSTQVGGIKKVIVHKRQGLEIPIRPKVLG
jgi:hypothetical protein